MVFLGYACNIKVYYYFFFPSASLQIVTLSYINKNNNTLRLNWKIKQLPCPFQDSA